MTASSIDEPAAKRPRLALSIPNMADPAELVDLGVQAEAGGWVDQLGELVQLAGTVPT